MSSARSLVLLLLLAPLTLWAASVPPPRDLTARAGLTQRLGAQVPMDVHFRDALGRDVTLAGAAHGKPILLALGYYRCPNLCGLVLHGILQAAAAMPLTPGSDYAIVFASIDPHETPADAAEAARMLQRMQPRAKVERWQLLTGQDASIRALAAAIGFRYFFDARIHQYVHPAAVTILSADGRIAQYFPNADYPAESLRLALIDASRGRLGSLFDQLVLLCCGYDPATGKYSLLIGRLSQGIGIAFVLLCALLLWRLHSRARA